MAETRTRIEKEVHEHLKGTPTAYLATLEDGQPRVRPVALVAWDGRLWITSGTRNGKTRQMRRNMDVELCVPISEEKHDGYVRVAAEARFVIDSKTREAVAKAVPFFKNYWEGPDDERFTLIEVVPTEIEYLRPKETEPHTVYL
jgi:uncharacterized pyridoxamine 5'-phosphate oxidase family protein